MNDLEILVNLDDKNPEMQSLAANTLVIAILAKPHRLKQQGPTQKSLELPNTGTHESLLPGIGQSELRTYSDMRCVVLFVHIAALFLMKQKGAQRCTIRMTGVKIQHFPAAQPAYS